jgi:hypothetical protein
MLELNRKEDIAGLLFTDIQGMLASNLGQVSSYFDFSFIVFLRPS